MASSQYINRLEMRIRRVRVAEPEGVYGTTFREPGDVIAVAQALIAHEAQEVFVAFFLDVRNRVVGYSEIGRGGIDSCPVDPRVVFRAALSAGATGVVLSHNHPSGDPEPSAADIAGVAPLTVENRV